MNKKPSRSVQISYCGVCCGHCGMEKHISKMAGELKRFVQAYKYGDWIAHVTQEFEFENFMKGLDWLAHSGCRGCLQGGGMPNCEVRECCRAKSLENCYFCNAFSECKKLNYQKETYKVNENFARIRQIGYEDWLKEQEAKMKTDFDNIYLLERKKA